jgi:putative metallohydrolase (TIGR04338 family)
VSLDAAEALAGASLRRYRRFDEIVAHVESIVTDEWWSDTFPDAPIDVDVQRRSRDATFSAAVDVGPGAAIILIVDGRAWGLDTVLHELAHVAAGTSADHGPDFEGALLELWRRHAGLEAWAVLDRELRAAPEG